MTRLSCDCKGFQRHGRCQHYALLLCHLGELPPAVSAAAQVPGSDVPAVLCDQCGEPMHSLAGVSFACACGTTYAVDQNQAEVMDQAISVRSRTDDQLLDTLTMWLSGDGVHVPTGTDPDMLPGREDAPALIGLAFQCSANDVAAVLRWQADREEVATRVAA